MATFGGPRGGWGDVALSGILLWRSALPSEVPRATTVEADVVRGSSSGQGCR
jgi:hypothetical protein